MGKIKEKLKNVINKINRINPILVFWSVMLISWGILFILGILFRAEERDFYLRFIDGIFPIVLFATPIMHLLGILYITKEDFLGLLLLKKESTGDNKDDVITKRDNQENITINKYQVLFDVILIIVGFVICILCRNSIQLIFYITIVLVIINVIFRLIFGVETYKHVNYINKLEIIFFDIVFALPLMVLCLFYPIETSLLSILIWTVFFIIKRLKNNKSNQNLDFPSEIMVYCGIIISHMILMIVLVEYGTSKSLIIINLRNCFGILKNSFDKPDIFKYFELNSLYLELLYIAFIYVIMTKLFVSVFFKTILGYNSDKMFWINRINDTWNFIVLIISIIILNLLSFNDEGIKCILEFFKVKEYADYNNFALLLSKTKDTIIQAFTIPTLVITYLRMRNEK